MLMLGHSFDYNWGDEYNYKVGETKWSWYEEHTVYYLKDGFYNYIDLFSDEIVLSYSEFVTNFTFKINNNTKTVFIDELFS